MAQSTESTERTTEQDRERQATLDREAAIYRQAATEVVLRDLYGTIDR